MKNNRPVNLDLFTIRLPLPALVSILHRVSGFLLLLAIPLFVWLLQGVTGTEEDFIRMKDCLSSIWFKIFLWGCCVAFLYHLSAGVRHLLMDIGIGESLESGRMSAFMVLIASVLFSAAMGYLIW